MSEAAPYEIFELDPNILIFLGNWGDRGLMRRHGSGEWEFHPSGSLVWDSFHQEVYRNFKASRLTPQNLEHRGIPLPDLEEASKNSRGMAWQDNFKAAVPWSEVPPGVCRELAQHAGERVDAYLVLVEDGYETSFGDGRYLYPEVAFWTRRAAQQEIKRRQEGETDSAKRQWYRYSVKRVTLLPNEAKDRVLSELNVQVYEHVSLDDVLRLLAEQYDPKR